MQNQETISHSADTEGDRDASKHDGGDATAEAKEAVSREMSDAKHRLSSATQDLRRDAAGKVSSLVSDNAERRKDDAVDGLRSFAETIRAAADDLGARDDSMSARFVQEAAHGLERLSDGLQARSVSEIMRSVTAFGRENPATFIAGCLLAGVAAGRFVVASGQRADRSTSDDRDFGAGGKGAWRGDADHSPRDYSASQMGMSADAAGGPYSGSDRMSGSGSGGLERGYDGSRQAGVFGGPVSPSSAERAPGDIGDAQGTAMDTPQPSRPGDVGTGEVRTASDGFGGGRDGDL